MDTFLTIQKLCILLVDCHFLHFLVAICIFCSWHFFFILFLDNNNDTCTNGGGYGLAWPMLYFLLLIVAKSHAFCHKACSFKAAKWLLNQSSFATWSELAINFICYGCVSEQYDKGLLCLTLSFDLFAATLCSQII